MAPTERKLAAILSADVVGYSRLMAEDEAGTIQTLSTYREEVELHVRRHRGRLVDFTGDNFLGEFPTALEAVRSAVEIQRVLEVQNSELPPERRMEFRMGIHLGEVASKEERLYGDGVNIAARVQALADAGGVCVSGTVYDLIHTKLGVGFDDLGAKSVKNIPDPVRVFRVREAPLSGAQPPLRTRSGRLAVAAVIVAVVAIAVAVYFSTRPPILTGPPLTSIAILPFEDMSPGGDQAWLANGMAEELIEALSRIEALQVMARTSSFALRGKDIETVGAKLKVGSVVEGSVRRSGDELRITAQLIRVSDGTHLWSARYDRKLADVFAIQSETAREIAEAVRSALGVEDEWIAVSLRRHRYAPRDIRAYELWRRGLEGLKENTEESLREAMEYHLQALEIDPDFAAAHTFLGWSHMSLWTYGYDRSDEHRSSARAAASRALELDPTDDNAHELLSHLTILQGKFEDAERRLTHAIKANSDSAGPRVQYAFLLSGTGRLEEALVQARRAVALDPLYAVRYRELGDTYVRARQYDAAIESAERALELNPHEPFARDVLSSAYHYSGDGLAALEAVVRGSGLPARDEAALREGYDSEGYAGLVRAAVELNLAQGGTPCTVTPELSAHWYALIGEADQMYECMDEAIAKAPGLLVFYTGIKVHPNFDPYRDDPRFTALLRRMGLEE